MALFARRHYKAIAECFRVNKPQPDWNPNTQTQHDALLREVVDLFRRDNANFQPQRFVDAAGGWACP